MRKLSNAGNTADALTGERVFPNEEVFDTGLPNKRHPYQNSGRTLFLKESTIVWLAEEAGLIVKRDVGDSGDSEGVDESDVGVGVGEVEVGEVEVGGGSAPKRRSGGKTKGK